MQYLGHKATGMKKRKVHWSFAANFPLTKIDNLGKIRALFLWIHADAVIPLHSPVGGTMRCRILFIVNTLVVCTAMTLQAQPSFSVCGSGSLKPGDSLVSTSIKAVICDTVGVSAGNAGAGVTWNFSGLIAKTTYSTPVSTTYYYAPSSTPWASYFPSATIASKSKSSSTYAYTYATSTATGTWGNYTSGTKSDNGACYVLSQPYVYFTCPCSYGCSFTNETRGYMCGTNSFGTTLKTTTKTYDGYGTLILPIGSYPNTVRFKTLETTIDSSFAVMLGVTSFVAASQNTTESYVWYTSDFSHYLLTISSMTVMNTYSKSVAYMIDSSVAVSTAHGKEHRGKIGGSGGLVKVTVLTPSSISLRIANGSPLVSKNGWLCTMYDRSGRKVTVLRFSESGQRAVCSNLAQGMYVYLLSNGETVLESGRIINP
jgi:hypothetical protein